MADIQDVSDVVDTLAQAKNPAELVAAHRHVRQTVRASRRRAAATLGPLARAYTEAMEIMDAQKAAGVPFDERIKGLEAVLRSTWPQTRAWHVLCAACGDYGLEMFECPGDATCGRVKPHLAHTYGRPCWCAKGPQFRDKPKPDREDFAAAGQSKSMTKVGRK